MPKTLNRIFDQSLPGDEIPPGAFEMNMFQTNQTIYKLHLHRNFLYETRGT